MKKFILLAAVSSTFIMCKKGEVSQSQIENAINSGDSAATIAAETIHSANTTINKALDSATVKIKEFENTREDIKETIESTSKSIDSLSDKIASAKLESKMDKKDSASKQNEKVIVNVPAPKIIKETKVVYKDKPNKDSYELSTRKNKIIKTGILELSVEDLETAKEIVKEEVKKYDGFIRSENISLNNNDNKIAYLKIKVPIQKFEYLMDELSHDIGKIENKGVEISGDTFVENTMCDMEITLYGTAEGFAGGGEPKTFGEKSFAAISSGWEVITSIFLFLLPLWPLFLIAGIGYYFYKKRNKNTPDNTI